MFTERELLIMSFAVDKMGDCELIIDAQELFFEQKEAEALCHKIHNVLRATRLLDKQTA